ncbi:TetR family transcriptional regulator [Stappia sp. GBMRC 2046]|uniref:TetR family transcriptional regulator n=1 Tax=Stappia sediminis TaxID=2692190 RepID=A0A7X3S713_9HYPH|nr:TetR/AcrR family transcriptional regulator [Stappia sediminis]MXN64363.1 TetR family transcriptional regulator [Stappia sediminis]
MNQTRNSARKTAVKRKSGSREKIIDAALVVVSDQGLRRFSLEAVAEIAGVSKGGLLYNFPTKSDLLKAMVARHVEEFSDQFDKTCLCLSAEGKRNSVIRAYLTTFRDYFCVKEQSPSGFLAAIAEEPGLLDPVREQNARIVKEIRSKSDNPKLAMAAFLTIAGIRHTQLFSIDCMSREETLGVIGYLLEQFE